MSVYIITFLFAVIFSYFADKIKKKNLKQSNIILGIALLPMAVVSAIRHNVGIDYDIIYVRLWNSVINGMKFNKEASIGIEILMKISALFTDNYVIFFVVTTLIIFILFFKVLKDNSNNYCLSVIIFFVGCYFFESMNLVRQYITMFIFLYAFKYIVEKKFKEYFISIMIATSIHTIAIIYLPMYFICRLKNVKIQYIAIAISVLLYNIITAIIFKVISYTEFSWYFNSRYDLKSISVIPLLTNSFIWLLAISLYKEEKCDEKYLAMLWIQFMAIFVTIFSKFIPQCDRITIMFSIIQIIFIPDILSKFKYNSTRYTLTIGIALLYAVIVLYYNVIIKGGYGVLPYQTIF